MKLSRRTALKTLAAVPMARLTPGGADELTPTLLALAEVVLPAEADRKAAVAAFVSWHDHYQEGADTDHGYGNTRIRATGPAPSRDYAAQVARLDAAARTAGAASFAVATLEQRRAIVEAAIAEAKVERLPARPSGAHLATDLMGHYFNSSAANDLCYRAAIQRDACRGLAGSENAPRV
jgi:hypothetical protein